MDTLLLPIFNSGKFRLDRNGRPFLTSTPSVSTTFAVMLAESMTSTSFAASLPEIVNATSLVVILSHLAELLLMT